LENNILSLPDELAAITGPLLAVERPRQGMAFQVYILTTASGRYILKIGNSPAHIQELMDECRILTTLQNEQSFVAQPLGNAKIEKGHAFLFTYLEGESLLIALERADVAGRHRLIALFAETLRRVHSWIPTLPRPSDWLTETLSRVGTKIMAMALNTLVSHTNSRFDGLNAHKLYLELLAWRVGVSNEPVFGHGDYCLPNVIVRSERLSGIIDWSRGGYADKRFDIATALFTLRIPETLRNNSYLDTFLQAYGYTESVESLHYFEALHTLTCML
jgi:aminoglycoside phosphotransferase